MEQLHIIFCRGLICGTPKSSNAILTGKLMAGETTSHGHDIIGAPLQYWKPPIPVYDTFWRLLIKGFQFSTWYKGDPVTSNLFGFIPFPLYICIHMLYMYIYIYVCTGIIPLINHQPNSSPTPFNQLSSNVAIINRYDIATGQAPPPMTKAGWCCARSDVESWRTKIRQYISTALNEWYMIDSLILLLLLDETLFFHLFFRCCFHFPLKWF